MIRFIRKIVQLFVDQPFDVGEVIHQRYKIIDMLGAGSYGIVYLCIDTLTQEQKVVKQLRPSKRKSKKDIKLYYDEVAIIKELNHPQTPQFYEAFSEKGNYYFVMSYIRGRNLEEEIFEKKKIFTERESLNFLNELVQILNSLHSKNIYHLDLRIPNILYKDYKPCLIDFGLARKAKRNDSPSLVKKWKLQDYYDLGDILLYLLYTTYPTKTKKALPWTEELSLHKETVYLLKKLLGIDAPYSTIEEIAEDLSKAIMVLQEIN